MTSLPHLICGHALQDPSTDSRKAKKWKPGNTGTRTRNTGRQHSEPGVRDGQPGGPSGNEKTTRGKDPGRFGERWPRPGGQARESRPIPDGALLTPVSGGPSKAECPRLRPARQGVDILHGAPVNAPATGVPNRRKPLSGRRLRPESACGRWGVNTQAWVDTRSV